MIQSTKPYQLLQFVVDAVVLVQAAEEAAYLELSERLVQRLDSHTPSALLRAVDVLIPHDGIAIRHQCSRAEELLCA